MTGKWYGENDSSDIDKNSNSTESSKELKQEFSDMSSILISFSDTTKILFRTFQKKNTFYVFSNEFRIDDISLNSFWTVCANWEGTYERYTYERILSHDTYLAASSPLPIVRTSRSHTIVAGAIGKLASGTSSCNTISDPSCWYGVYERGLSAICKTQTEFFFVAL